MLAPNRVEEIMADLHVARRCFDDILSFYREHPEASTPEQFNLYQGLAIMVEALAEIQAQITDIQSNLAELPKKR
jgi:hypothetical protein